jgi:hypothetical protein
MNALVPNSTPSGISLLLIELGFVLVALALAFCCSQRRSALFSRLENLFRRLARRRALSVAAVVLSAGALRLLFLPRIPIPEPFITSDFSFLLAADTFASGRLTNPTHPMWVHFESLHITHQPTYMSMYFPAQGMVLAAGKVLAGHAWWGVWASTALMCGAICWMLQGWLPPGWALLGGMLAVLRLGLFSYWIDSYAGGAIAAIGGALIMGALPRILRGFRTRDFFWMVLGIVLLANSRPYEGALVATPAVLVLACCLVGSRSPSGNTKSCFAHLLGGVLGGGSNTPRPPITVLARRMAPAAALLVMNVAAMAYYNHRVFGNALTLPYTVNRATYASAPHFLWQSARPEPVYRHASLRKFYSGWELDWFRKSRTPGGLVKNNAKKAIWGESFYLGFTLGVPLLMLARALRDKRIRFLVVTTAVFVIGLAIETWLIPHYMAPFTAILFAIMLQCMRHLRVWRPGGRPSGLFLVRALPAICVLLVGLRLYAGPLNLTLAPDTFSSESWFGTSPRGLPRARVLKQLETNPGPQLAIVRYSPSHDPVIEWVYNSADIDRSKVVWARDMDPASNRELLRYFHERKAWLVEPDFNPPRVSRYSTAEAPPETQLAEISAGKATLQLHKGSKHAY